MRYDSKCILVAIVYSSGSQTCSNRYPNQSSDYVLLPSKFFFAFQVENFYCSDHSYYRPTLWFWFRVTHWRIAYYSREVIYCQFGNHWSITTKSVAFHSFIHEM